MIAAAAREVRTGIVAVALDDWVPGGAVRLASGIHARLIGSFDDEVRLEDAVADYARLGERCFAKLRGQFALFVWDDRRRCVWAVRDPMGLHPLFWSRAGDSWLFASSAAELSRHPRVGGAINRLAVADSFRNSWPLEAETFFERVERVPPGHALRISAEGGKSIRYWMPRGEAIRWLRDDEMAEFEPQFERAVSRSLGPCGTGIFLSGGLDSVSVAAMASSIALRERMPRPRAMSLVFPHPESNESVVQESVAERLGITQVMAPLESLVDGPGGVLGGTLAISRQLDAPAINLWLSAYVALARRGLADGCSTILTGTGGDEWLGITPVLAADLVAEGRVREWARLMALGWRSSRHAGTPRALYNYAWHYSLRPHFRDWAVRLARRTASGWLAGRRRRRAIAGLPAWLLPDPALRRCMAERSERYDREQDERKDPSYYVEELRQALDHPLSSQEHEEWFGVYGPLGIRTRHPFYDADLVEFLFRVRPETLLAAGRSKGLVRDTLARRFPGLGFESQKKVEASAYFRALLQREAPVLWKQFGDFRALRELGIAEPARIPRPEEFGRGPYRDQFYLWLLLNTEAWLRPRM